MTRPAPNSDRIERVDAAAFGLRSYPEIAAELRRRRFGWYPSPLRVQQICRRAELKIRRALSQAGEA